MTQDITTAIFLGAGASAAEGAPMQSALFKKYFQSEENDGGWGVVRNPHCESQKKWLSGNMMGVICACSPTS